MRAAAYPSFQDPPHGTDPNMKRCLPSVCLCLSLLAVCCVTSGTTANAAQAITEKVENVGSYQLYVPLMEKGKEPALLVWLHPAGGENNELITRWWPELHEIGYALMLPKSKEPQRWALEETATVLAYIDHAIQKYGIDRRKVVLLGHSIGGHMAFHMGMKHADRLAGIVTTSGFTIRSRRDTRTALPPKECKDSLAYFMIVGAREGPLVDLAKRAQLELLADGFSAVLHVVKGGGHAFHDSEKKNVLAWLKEVAAGKRPAAEEIKDLARTAPDRIRAYRAELARKSRLFNAIKDNIGKPYKLTWKPAGAVEQGGRLSIMLPEGWKLGDQASNGQSAAVTLTPPGKQHIVAYIGRSVKKEGLVEHYRKWFRKMARENVMTRGSAGRISANGRNWEVLTFFMVPREKQNDPLARRVLVVAVLPLNQQGTEWRSVSVICPEHDTGGNHIAEIIRGILEKTRFGEARAPE